MPFEHVNRKGDKYYLVAGGTKTGKPKYYTSKKLGGELLNDVPDGYEVHENPVDALVHVRKVRATQIMPLEREQVSEAIREMAGLDTFMVDVDGDSLIVYLPDQDETEISRMAECLGASGDRLKLFKAVIQQQCNYTAMLRFTLIDVDQRLFAAERWCFRGSIDNWMPLVGKYGTLDDQLRRFVPHLGQESFFELI